MAELQDFGGIQRGVTQYLNTLKSVISGITQSATGAVVGTGFAANAGLAVAFFQIMVQGIAEAEFAQKLNDKIVDFQEQQIKDLFNINLQQEQVAQQTIRSQVEANEAKAVNDINQARNIHFVLALVVVIVTVLLLFVAFPKKGR